MNLFLRRFLGPDIRVIMRVHCFAFGMESVHLSNGYIPFGTLCTNNFKELTSRYDVMETNYD